MKSVDEADDLTTIKLSDKRVFGNSTITMMFDPKSNELRQWTITDAKGKDTTVMIFNVQEGVKIDQDMFKIDYKKNFDVNQKKSQPIVPRAAGAGAYPTPRVDAHCASGNGRPAHISAASGLVWIGSQFYVVADDEFHLGVFSQDALSPGRLIRLFDGALPDSKAERKKRKPDLETFCIFRDRRAIPTAP